MNKGRAVFMVTEIDEILQRSLAGEEISRDECLRLMAIQNFSSEMYELFFVANKLTRDLFSGVGEVHAQVGIDYAYCPRMCQFCIFGKESSEHIQLSKEEVIARVKEFKRAGADAVYLMTTGAFDFNSFISIGESVRKVVSSEIPLVANIDDFDSARAKELADTGFAAIYHAVRLREGKDTQIDPKRRIATIECAKKAGLDIFFCVEPIGPEHSNDEIVDLMLLGKDLGVSFSGAMRRTSASGTPLHKYGEISWLDLAKIVAVTRIVMGDRAIAHCTHEPNIPSLLAGANLIWAETGPNPRDVCLDTSGSGGRGLTVQQCRNLLWEAGFKK